MNYYENRWHLASNQSSAGTSAKWENYCESHKFDPLSWGHMNVDGSLIDVRLLAYDRRQRIK